MIRVFKVFRACSRVLAARLLLLGARLGSLFSKAGGHFSGEGLVQCLLHGMRLL